MSVKGPATWDIGGFEQWIAATGVYRVMVVGASSGIGAAAAEFLGAMGIAIACVGRDRQRTEETATRVRVAGGQATAVIFDIADLQAVKDGIDGYERREGAIHGAINCSAIVGQTGTPLHEADMAVFSEVCRTNLIGAANLSQVLVGHMLPRRYGRIVHVSSIAGKEGNQGMAAYSASKAGLIGLVKSIGKDYAQSGITINALAPAVIETPMIRAIPEATVQSLLSKIPMARPGTLDEITSTLAWMISPALSFTTGFCFDLSGGRATY